MKKLEREFIKNWIDENFNLVITQAGQLLTDLKNTSTTYGEVIEKLNIMKKNISYRLDSKFLLPIIEAAIESVEHEKNTLSIKKEG